MRRIKLVWMAIGAGLASSAFLFAHFWQARKADPRFLYVSVAAEPAQQERALVAVGECTGQFSVSLPTHVFLIGLPIKDLSVSDFVCLTENLEPVRHTMFIKTKGASEN